MVVDKTLLDKVSEQAMDSPRLRMNYNFHQSLDDKCHRFLNAVEPGTEVPIHRHPTKDETFVILRGKVRVTTHRDDGSIIEDVVLSQESAWQGTGTWHERSNASEKIDSFLGRLSFLDAFLKFYVRFVWRY